VSESNGSAQDRLRERDIEMLVLVILKPYIIYPLRGQSLFLRTEHSSAGSLLLPPASRLRLAGRMTVFAVKYRDSYAPYKGFAFYGAQNDTWKSFLAAC